MDLPEVRYTRVDGLSLAWQQFGDGPDVLIIPGLVSNIELQWEHEFYRRANELCAAHLRLTVFDKRGMGLSERTQDRPTTEQRMGDIIAVMDEAGLERPHLLGLSEGGLVAQMFAAAHPDRVDKLLIGNSVVAGREPDPEHEAGMIHHIGQLLEHWGKDGRPMAEGFSPTHVDNDAFVRWLARLQRLSGTQLDAVRQVEDVRALKTSDPAFLADIAAPTLIINSSADQICDPQAGRWLHDRIPNSQQASLDTDDHFMWLGERWTEMCSLVIEFFTGSPVIAETTRCFGTVVFTDLVGSTAAAAAAGDRAWSETLLQHDEIAWRCSDARGGTIIKSTGDGLLVFFDVPHHAVAFCEEFRTAIDAEGLSIRAGIHSGEVEIRPDGDIAGFAVNLAARVEQAADNGTIWVSSTVRDMMMGGSSNFIERGEHTLKGFDDAWRLYELADS